MIEPVSTVSFRPFNMEIPRRSGARLPGAMGPAFRGPEWASRPDARLQEMIQAGRQTSALLSCLPGPNLGFFQAPSPLRLRPEKGLSWPRHTVRTHSRQPEPGRSSTSRSWRPWRQAGRPRPCSSGLTGPGRGPSRLLFRRLSSPDREHLPRAPATGAGAAAAASGTLPRASAPLLEAEQQGRISSTLFSGLAGVRARPPWGAAPSRARTRAWRTKRTGRRARRSEISRWSASAARPEVGVARVGAARRRPCAAARLSMAAERGARGCLRWR